MQKLDKYSISLHYLRPHIAVMAYQALKSSYLFKQYTPTPLCLQCRFLSLSLSFSVCLSVFLSVCLSVCLSVSPSLSVKHFFLSPSLSLSLSVRKWARTFATGAQALRRLGFTLFFSRFFSLKKMKLGLAFD